MLILAVTSSTAVVGVAVRRDQTLLASRHLSTDRRHAEELVPMIQSVLAESRVELADLDRFAVDVGPGRFTGLRVGVTTVRTLAFAVQKPVVAVSSLEALAFSQRAGDPDRVITAVIDARRAEVFQQRFDAAGPLDDADYGSAEDMAALLSPGDLVVGDGVDRYSEAYEAVAGLEVRLGVEPMASVIAELAMSLEAVEGPLVKPVYLREPDVKVNIKTRHNT